MLATSQYEGLVLTVGLSAQRVDACAGGVDVRQGRGEAGGVNGVSYMGWRGAIVYVDAPVYLWGVQG